MFPSFEIKKLFVQAWNFIKKETIAQVFSCEFCEIFKKIFFIEHLWWLLLSTSKQIAKTLEHKTPKWIWGDFDFKMFKENLGEPGPKLETFLVT